MNTEELKKLAMAATPGPWMYLLGDRFVYDRLNDGCRGNPIVGVDYAWAGNRNNLNYVAAANPAAIIALIERHDAAHSELLATRDDNHSMMLEIDGLRKVRDEAIAKLERAQAEIRALESKLLDREVQS